MQKSAIDLARRLRHAESLFTHRLSAHRQDLQAVEGAFAGRPVLVVGNGPSLNETPLEAFRGVPSIAMNKIDLIYDRTNWRPSLVTCVNDIVIRQHWRTWTRHLPPVYLAWKSRLHIPRRFRHGFRYFHARHDRRFCNSPADGLGSAETVTYTALQLALLAGADPVIIVGVDHSFTSNSPKGVYERTTGPDVNHFDPNYFASGQVWGTPDLEGSEEAYQRARLAFERQGRRVYDATINGKLQVFERVKISEAIEMANLNDHG